MLVVLDNPIMKDMFSRHLKGEFKLENLIIWQEIQNCKRTTSPTQRFAIAKLIYDSFIVTGSLFDLNIREKTRDTLEEKFYWILKNPEADDRISDILFENLEAEVFRNMKTSFALFVKISTEYKTFVRKQKIARTLFGSYASL